MTVSLLKPNNSCQCRCRRQQRRRCQRLGNIKSPFMWRLALFKSAKLKQNVAICCGLCLGHRLYFLHFSLALLMFQLCCSGLPVWFHLADKLRGRRWRPGSKRGGDSFLFTSCVKRRQNANVVQKTSRQLFHSPSPRSTAYIAPPYPSIPFIDSSFWPERK